MNDDGHAHARFWDFAPGADEVHEICVQVGEQLREEKAYREEELADWLSLYDNTRHSTLGRYGYQVGTQWQFGHANTRSAFNLIASAIDTLVAHATVNRVRPLVQSESADWDQQRLSRMASELIEGLFL